MFWDWTITPQMMKMMNPDDQEQMCLQLITFLLIFFFFNAIELHGSKDPIVLKNSSKNLLISKERSSFTKQKVCRAREPYVALEQWLQMPELQLHCLLCNKL